MTLLSAVEQCGQIPPDSASREIKQKYSQTLSRHLAFEVSEQLRGVGFVGTKPGRDGKAEKEFQGGLGPKRVDVSYSDEQHGLMFAITIKSICFAPFSKNLKNRFADLCTEAITLHLRFPYSVIGALFAFPATSADDHRKQGVKSTFERATRLMATISGRQEYTDPGEKFEDATMLLFKPVNGSSDNPWTKLIDARSGKELSEKQYLEKLRAIFDLRNPHLVLGELP